MNWIELTGRIWTGEPRRPWATAARVSGGAFVFVGRRRELTPLRGGDHIDTGSGIAVPGFTDGHAHLLATGAALRSVDLRDTRDEQDAAARVGERARMADNDEWIIGAGWDQNDWPGSQFPSRRSLGAAAPDNPVVLNHVSGHAVWVNSGALHAAGITRDTDDPVGGSIDRDADGEPTGVLRDNAALLVQRAMPRADDAQRESDLRSAIAHAHKLGVTCVHAMDIGRGEWRALQRLHERGELTLRVRAFLSARHLNEWIDAGLRTGDGDDTLRVGGVKFFTDGALGSMTAWMLEPYEGTDSTGIALQTVEELERGVRRALDAGLAPAVHAIGDRANYEALGLFERTHDIATELPRRVEHAQLLRPDDEARFLPPPLPYVVELRDDVGQPRLGGVTASVQPIHATADMRMAERLWGDRCSGAYAYRSLLDAGVNLAFGSDSPVETMDPLAGIHAGVTRRDAHGEPGEGVGAIRTPAGWHPEQRVPLEAALTAYTLGCARAVAEDGRFGRIAPGYAADLVVLSQDLFALEDPMRILDARVEATIVAGRVVYRREG